MKTPCVQSVASTTSGALVARRPPKRMTSSGTPCGASQSSAICGHCVAATVKRAFACAAGRPPASRGCPPSRSLGRRLVGEALPPHVAVRTQRDVREDGVAPQRLDRRDIRRLAGARRDAEESGFGVDRPEAAVIARAQPGDVVAEGLDAPAGDRRSQHCEVRLAARRGERRSDVVLTARGIDHADEQHVLGEPSFVAADDRGDAQREALLREDRVSAVAGAVRPHLERLGEVDDVLLVIARPRHILLAALERGADGMHRLHPRSAHRDLAQHVGADVRHDLDRGDRVAAVRDLNADLGEGSADGSRRRAPRTWCGRASIPRRAA